jgi:hypothetical protein
LNPYCQKTQPAEFEQWGKGWYSAYRSGVNPGGKEYSVTWRGMDDSFHENCFKTLDDAQRHAVSISELGGHSIAISDDDGYDYVF